MKTGGEQECRAWQEVNKAADESESVSLRTASMQQARPIRTMTDANPLHQWWQVSVLHEDTARAARIYRPVEEVNH